MARMRRFSQPSEVAEPLELLRAGIVFHARGLVNTRAIQHNLDWVWPYWVVRQFDPGDPSFIPRAFSFSHVNLTHRNWTAVGLPNCAQYPIVDPCGLLTPLHDGWSIDCWIVGGDEPLVPSRRADVEQHLELSPRLAVQTRSSGPGCSLELDASVVHRDGRPCVRLVASARGGASRALAIAVRPYNPEGVQFIDRLGPLDGDTGFRVNDTTDVALEPAADSMHFDTYSRGDVFHALPQDGAARTSVRCPVGMATGAALYWLDDRDGHRQVVVTVPLGEGAHGTAGTATWAEAHAGAAALEVPDARLRFLHDAARTTLVLHSVEDIVPGPYTYRRFWFRDACLILHALLASGYHARARQALDRFPQRQRASGYFQSQEGEWDSNGQVLWVYGRFCELTGESPAPEWLDAIERGVRWIARKRLRADAGPGIAGLLPAGFSAEHLGPNDYYYWDDWWALAGLRAAEPLLARAGRRRAAERARREARSLRVAIEASLRGIPRERSGGAMPAAPGRRMDAGAIGSLVVDYPLHLLPPGDPAVMRTVDYLVGHSFHDGGFFQNMIHSGINAYLTLDIAQTLLRAGQPHRAWPLIRRVAELASPTGQWPEAIHPATGGGCMGDGQHVWAAAEWVMAMRTLFLREEGETLVLGCGLPREWLDRDERLAFGPTATAWGPVRVVIECCDGSRTLHVEATWRGRPPRLRACVPGMRETDVPADGCPVALEPARG